jgi:hypothetical protein
MSALGQSRPTLSKPHHDAGPLPSESNRRQSNRDTQVGETARSAQHAAGNLDNRHVEIVCAASARVNVSVLYQFVDGANWPWPIGFRILVRVCIVSRCW